MLARKSHRVHGYVDGRHEGVSIPEGTCVLDERNRAVVENSLTCPC